MGEKNPNPRIIYSLSIDFQSEEEIKTFSDKHRENLCSVDPFVRNIKEVLEREQWYRSETWICIKKGKAQEKE